MSEDHLIYYVEDEVAWFTINREKQRNAISGEAISLFMKYLDQAEADAEVRAICVTGSGDRAFCSGGDLAGGMLDNGMDPITGYANLIKRLAGFPKPSVARVNPRNRAPQSPMNTLAGGKLKHRNPMHDPARAVAMSAPRGSPFRMQMNPMDIEAKSAAPAATPSLPSIRLKAFVVPTIQTSVISNPASAPI